MNESPGVRVLFIFQSLLGFIVVASLLVEAQLTERRAEGEGGGFIVRTETEEDHPDQDLEQTTKAMYVTLAKVVLLWIVGSLFIAYYEDQDASEASYFIWVSMSTIGFGDWCVQKDLTKILVAIFLLLSCSLVVSVNSSHSLNLGGLSSNPIFSASRVT